MIRKLVLIRHGDAEYRRLGETDAQRRLTNTGLKALQREYPAMLAPLSGDLDDLQVWSSEAVRARQTAEVACDVLGVEPEAIEFHRSLYAQDFMEEVSGDLTGTFISFPKGSIACFEVRGNDLRKAQLLWFARGPEA